MSNEALTWGFKSGIPPGPRFVLVVLGDAGTDHAGEDWTCFPAVATIARMTGYNRRTVERHLDWLWRNGWISRKRRRRADGTLGIYDWTLHRDGERRAELAEARKPCAAEDCDDEQDDNLSSGDLFGPHDIDDAGHTTKTTEPHDKLPGHEPSRNHHLEPSPDERASTASQKDLVGFDQAASFYPLSGQARTDWPTARASWARACELVTSDRLAGAIRRYAVEAKFGDFGAPAFERWLQREGWRPWLSEEVAGQAQRLDDARRWQGPAELRAAIVADPALGEGFAVSYLDPALWVEGERQIVPRNGVGRSAWLRREAAEQLQKFEIEVAAPDRAASVVGG